MSLSSGTKLGQFQILEPLGAGTMGEVYLARDEKLGRKVAIKVLPDSLAQDPQRLARLEREAKTLAALDHPNIGALYDFQNVDDVHFLVLQLIEGKTLQDLIARGPMPLDEAIPIFIQIAHALEAAHERDVVHRDLKPANVKVALDGTVKVLDFGLAKMRKHGRPESPDDSSLSSASHQLTQTQDGMIVGTPSYMSPEQARARDVDKRTDIWAFGCTLFEALSGTRPYTAETTADLVAHIIRDDPNWGALPEDLPAGLVSLLHRCIEREIRKRLKDAGDIAISLEEILAGAHNGSGDSLRASSVQGGRGEGVPKRRSLLASIVVLLAVAGVAAVVWLPRSAEKEVVTRQTPRPKPVRRFSIGISPEYPLKKPNPVIGDNVIALSPDGKTLVYVSESGGQIQLIRRRLDRLEAEPIPGSAGAWSPFFSADGEWVGFQERGNKKPKLMKLPIEGGVPVPLGASELPFGGTWTETGDIIFGRNLGTGLWRVAAEGGTPEPLTELDLDAGESAHAIPQVLPGGSAVLFNVGLSPPSADHAQLRVVSLGSQARITIAEDVGRGAYVPSGHIVYTRPKEMWAVPFDAKRLEVTGPAVPVTESRMGQASEVPRNFAISDEGTLIYAPSEEESARSLVWVDREGNEEAISAPRRDYSSVRIAPDGSRLALDHTDLDKVWIYDLVRGATQRLTFSPANDYRPIWAPDGEYVLFISARDKETAIYKKRSDGVGDAIHLVTYPGYPYPDALTPDGKTLIFKPVASMAPVWRVDLAEDGEPQVVLEGKFNERDVRVSPDGAWISYESAETGRFEIYVQSFPEPVTRLQISINGGDDAVWGPEGDELFYWEGNRLMRVEVQTEPSFRADAPIALFELEGRVAYDISPEGDRFIVIVDATDSVWVNELIVVENWFEELKRLAPATPASPSESSAVQ